LIPEKRREKKKEREKICEGNHGLKKRCQGNRAARIIFLAFLGRERTLPVEEGAG